MKNHSDFGSLVLTILSAVLSSCSSGQTVADLIPVSTKALYDTSSVWYAHFDSYPDSLDKLPVGVMVSGLDEMAVMEKFLTADSFDNITGEPVPDGICDFAGERFYLLLDHADGPYPGYLRDSAGVALLRDVAVRNSLRLMGGGYYIIPDDDIATGVKEPVKLLVNVPDATSLYCQDDIDTLLSTAGIGVKSLNPVSAAVSAALSRTRPGEGCAIGVLASQELGGTGRYEEIIRRDAARAGLGDRVQVFQQICRGLDEAVEGDASYVYPLSWCVRSDYRGPVLGTEEGDIDINMMDRYGFDRKPNALLCRYEGTGSCVEMQLNSAGNYARYHLVTLVEKHRRSGSRIPMRAIILGNKTGSFVLDTLKTVISELYDFRRDGQYIYRNSICEDVEFIDPAECLVRESYSVLRNGRMLALNTTRTELTSLMSIPAPELPSSAVDTVTLSFSNEFRYGRTPGSERVTEKMIPFSTRYIGAASFKFMDSLFPETTRQMRKKLY